MPLNSGNLRGWVNEYEYKDETLVSVVVAIGIRADAAVVVVAYS